jgi:hypothetical protein
MPNNFCESCKPDKPEIHAQVIKNDVEACTVLYEKVNICMKKNDGSISMCREEWSSFRACHETTKIS